MQTPKAENSVVTSPVMVAPTWEKMSQRRAYPAQRIPPAVHARTWYDADRGVAGMTYNGHDILTIQCPAQSQARLRFHSDGNFLSAPFTQQGSVSLDAPETVQVTLSAPVAWWNMRPRRAQSGEAILGQVGAPLLYGVNGCYIPDWDLLLSWHGQPFDWQESKVIQDEAGMYTARMTVQLSPRPWLILVRPHFYRQHLGFAQHAPWDFRPKQEPITGWCSWEAYHAEVAQQHITEAAQKLQGLRPYGLSTMQLDDGYQQEVVPPEDGGSVCDCWLNLNEKFPQGHGGIVGAMTGGGFAAGIWTNATLTNGPGADALGICLRTADGTALQGDWIQYVLDCEPGTLATQTTPYYRAFRQAGYTYFKSDSLRHLLFDGLQEAVRLGLMDDATARAKQRAYMEAARAGIGADAYYLSCWGVLSESIGVCDAMRIATDSNPTWGSFSMQVRETARWFGAQRVLFTIDPDVVCVRGPVLWARMLLSLVALTGGLMMISDKPENYDEERLALIRRTIPGLPVHAGETGPIDYTTPACCGTRGRDEVQASFDIAHTADCSTPEASLWCTHFDVTGRTWCVLQRTAVVPLEALALGVEALCLDPNRSYVAFDYWQQQAVPVVGGRLTLPALTLGDTTVLSLVETKGNVPVLLGSDRHVSMDMVSVTDYQAQPGQASLTLAGFAGLTVQYTLYAPGFQGQVRQVEGCAAQYRQSGDILQVTVIFETENARVTLG